MVALTPELVELLETTKETEAKWRWPTKALSSLSSKEVPSIPLFSDADQNAVSGLPHKSWGTNIELIWHCCLATFLLSALRLNTSPSHRKNRPSRGFEA